jgi:pyruvate/2-oxoglutarate dehydrogenase complex dihydrolipoamide acyltransferase (E2) component
MPNKKPVKIDGLVPISAQNPNDSRFTGFHNAVEVWHREIKNVWQIQLVNEIESDRLEALRESYKKRGIKPPSYTALVIKAIAMAMDEERKLYPEINAFIRRFLWFRKIVVFDRISCGCVVSVEIDGQDRVGVVVVEDPEKKSFQEITTAIQSFSEPNSAGMKNIKLFYGVPKLLQMFFNWIGALSTTIRFESRGTFSITTVGKFGVDVQGTPQSGSLQFGFGVIRDRVVARDGKPFVAPTFNLTCCFDRRIMNGKAAARVLDRIRKILNAADFPKDSGERE